MASRTAILDRYKLDSLFDGDTVVHTTFESVVEVKTSWKRERKLGSGAFGVVWREKKEESEELRAVKVIPRQHVNLREVEALVALQDHPEFFVLFLGWFEDVHFCYIAMEYIAHGDLGQYIQTDRERAKSEVKSITSQILGGLVILHGKEICHRDIKPQNILISCLSPIRIKISDFGISKCSVGTSLRTGCGTVCYQAPEQQGLLPREMRSGNSYTNAIDLWALGTIVHEILASEIPFLDTYQEMDSGMAATGDSCFVVDTALLFSYCQGSTPFPSQSLQRAEVSVDGINFVKSLMMVNPRDRLSAVDALNNRWLNGVSPVVLDFPKLINHPASSFANPTAINPHGLPELPAINSINRPVTNPSMSPSIQLLSGSVILRNQFELLGISLSPDDALHLYGEYNKAAIIDTLQYRNPIDLQIKAVQGGHNEVVRVLLRVLDNDAIKDQQLLMHAAIRGHVKVMQLLLDRGAEINVSPVRDDSPTILQAAVESGNLDAMKLLVQRGADVNVTAARYSGLTALQAVALRGDLDAVRFLVNSGANVNAVPVGQGCLTAVAAALKGGHIEMLKLLVQSGADVNAESAMYGGLTAVQTLAQAGNVDALKFLVRGGADINVARTGPTALQAVAERGDLDAIKFLIHGGADVNAAPSGVTALWTMAQRGDIAAVKFLVESGADVNPAPARDGGLTVVQAAAQGGHRDVVQFLLLRGADIKGLLAREGSRIDSGHESVSDAHF